MEDSFQTQVREFNSILARWDYYNLYEGRKDNNRIEQLINCCKDFEKLFYPLISITLQENINILKDKAIQTKEMINVLLWYKEFSILSKRLEFVIINDYARKELSKNWRG